MSLFSVAPRPAETTRRSTTPPQTLILSLEASRAVSRADLLVVATLCALALSLEVHLSGVWHLGFDETWHLSIASVQPFSQFVTEVRWDAHPPLFLFLLRALIQPVLWFTSYPAEILPRMISVLASLGTIAIAYRCALEMELARPVALLSALLFAVSSTHLNLAICVRGYSLSTVLTCTALLFFLRILRDPAAVEGRIRLGFVVASCLAVWTESVSALVVMAAFVVLAFECTRRPGFLRALCCGADRRIRWREPVLLFLAGGALLGWMSWSPGTGLSGHVSAFYPGEGESLVQFARRGFVSTLDQFTPLGLSSQQTGPLASLSFLLLLGFLTLRYLTSASGRDRLRASILLILVQVWSLIFVLATHRIYPHGGKMRHQFVLFPLLAFVLLFSLDEAYRRARTAASKKALCIAFAAVTIGTSLAGLRGAPSEEFSPTTTLWVEEIQAVLREREPNDPIYVAAIDGIAVFSHLRDRRWTLGASGPSRLEMFSLEKKDSAPIHVLRESSVWWFPDPLDEGTVKRLVGSFSSFGIEAAWVLALNLEWRDVTPERLDGESTRALLAAEGIELDRRLVFRSGEALRVRLRPSGSGADEKRLAYAIEEPGPLKRP